MLAYIAPIALLIGSNIFMTFAWYGHLKFTDRPLWIVILVSWGIAFFEYCLQVPGNRIGYSRLQPRAIEDNPGNHHAGRFRGVLDFVFERCDQMESPRRLRADRRGGVFYFSRLARADCVD